MSTCIKACIDRVVPLWRTTVLGHFASRSTTFCTRHPGRGWGSGALPWRNPLPLTSDSTPPVGITRHIGLGRTFKINRFGLFCQILSWFIWKYSKLDLSFWLNSGRGLKIRCLDVNLDSVTIGHWVPIIFWGTVYHNKLRTTIKSTNRPDHMLIHVFSCYHFRGLYVNLANHHVSLNFLTSHWCEQVDLWAT